MTNDDANLMTEQAVADRLGISRQTLANWRYLGRFAAELPYVRLGRKIIRYRREDVETFIQDGWQGEEGGK